MSSKYEAPQEVRELERQIRDFSRHHGLNTSNVLHDLLLYIIHNFSLPDTPTIKHWPYTPEQNRAFYEMFTAWVGIMKRQIARHGFYDAFGDLFMALNPQRELQRQGQFLTPTDVARVCLEIVTGKDENKGVQSVYDPAAGSGRMLIASRTYHPRSYLVGWDIDYTCCLMCVCNFLINSCVGEVACINTITMGDFRGAWLVNEAYYRTGMPSVRWLDKQEYTRHHMANIPPYVFFLDSKSYDDYFRWREAWRRISALCRNRPRPQDDTSAPPTAGNEMKKNNPLPNS